MAEITPLTPGSPVQKPRRIERDEKRKEPRRRPGLDEDDRDRQPDAGPARHIDERV